MTSFWLPPMTFSKFEMVSLPVPELDAVPAARLTASSRETPSNDRVSIPAPPFRISLPSGEPAAPF